MIEFLLKASFVSAIAWLFYKTVLQQESFFTANRFYLMAALGIGFILPLVNLPPLVSHQGVLSTMLQTAQQSITHSQPTRPFVSKSGQLVPLQEMEATNALGQHPLGGPQRVEQENQRVESQESTGQFSLIFWLIALYLFGIAIFMGNLLFQLGSIWLKITKSVDKVQDSDCVIVNVESKQAPCSFFQYIFIHPDDYDYDTYEQIIAHEKIHVWQKHSLDLLLAELTVILLWFNPLSWMLKKEIEKNIEYQTDSLLLERGQVSKNQYQLSLVQIATPHKPLTITTNYNQSLLKQRILMMNAKKSTLHSYWKYTFLAPLFFVTLLLLNRPAKGWMIPNPSAFDEIPKVKQAQAIQPATPAAQKDEDDDDLSKGFWYGHQQGDKYCLDLKATFEASRGNWNISRCFAKALFQKKENDNFYLTREAGTLVLTGKLEEEISQGKYVFTKDASFEQYLEKNKISLEKHAAIHLFMADVNRAYIDFLKQQYPQIEGDELTELAIHGIGMKDYQAYMDLFKKYSGTKPSMEEVIDARIHGIDEAYVQEIQAMGFTNLRLDKMMEAKIHGVNATYVEGLKKAGFTTLTLDEMMEAKIHGLNAASIGQMHALGFGKLSLEEMMDVQIHGVTPAYVAELKAAGFKELDLDKIVEAKIHGITLASIQEIQKLGFGKLSMEDMINVKIHGLTASYIQDLKKAGFDQLTIDQMMDAKIHGLNAASIQELQSLGFGKLSLDKLTEAKMHGVNSAYVGELKAAGFKDLDVDKVIEAKIHGIDSEFIKEANKKGYNLKSIDDYIELKLFARNRKSKSE